MPSGAEFELVVRNGSVVAHDRVFLSDVGISDGTIVAVGPELGHGLTEHDATGMHVLPGLIDVHVHMRDPGWPEKSDFIQGTQAAAAGGVTMVVDMPNTNPPVLDAASLIAKRDRLLPKAHVDFGLYGLLSTDNAGGFSALADAGAMGLKLYMARSVVPLPIPGDDEILIGLEASREAGLVVGVHAENERLVQLFSERLRAAGATSAETHSRARPEIAEVEAITRIITLAAAAGADLHIHHLSTAAGLEQIRRLRRPAARVTAEAIVPHLCLDERDYARHGNLIKLNPPIRTDRDVEALWQGIVDGEVTIVATDHAPHTDDEQAAEDVWCAHGGFIGVETLLAMMLTEGAQHGLAVQDVVRLCSYEPARRWRIPRKGEVEVGNDADLVLVDLSQPSTITSGALHGACRATPFAGTGTVATIRRTYLRGTLVSEDGVVAGPPTGRFVSPVREVGAHGA